MTSMLLFFEFLACHTASDYRWGEKGLSDSISRKPVLLSGVLVFGDNDDPVWFVAIILNISVEVTVPR
jgi:hypothetical protein